MGPRDLVCGRDLTDGYVTHRALTQVSGLDVADLADELVRVALWEHFADGYVFHDYLKYNPSQNEVLTYRAVREAVASKGGKARASGAKRSRTGQFTSVDAGLDAGELPSVAPSPVSRLPSPVIPKPSSHIAAAGTAAMVERRGDASEEGAA